MTVTVNYWAIILATVVAFGIGGLWYSVLFQKPWMRLMGITQEDMKAGAKAGGLTAGRAMFIEFLVTLVTAYILAHFVALMGTHTWSTTLQLGFALWIGFQAPMLLSDVLFARQPLQLFAINAGQRLVSVFAMALIIGLWI